jgi:hypothetical protein
MFITLLIVSFLTSFLVCVIVAELFKKPIESILKRLIAEEIYTAWSRYITFAIYVAGISGGVRIWDLEKYITPHVQGQQVVELNMDRWVLETYRTIIGTLQSTAWMLLLVFLVSLFAFVVLKGVEMWKAARSS